MKKVIVTVVSALVAASVFAEPKISLTNTLGGDADNVAGKNFLRFDDDLDKENVSISDRVQLDLTSEQIDSRIRLEFPNAVPATDAPILKAYVNFRPFEQLNFIGGNKFFWKHATPGAYLAATDDYLNHGKLADDNGAGVVYAFKNDDFGLKLAGAFASESRLNLNFGAEFALNDTATFGVTFQDVTEETISIGAYAALGFVENLLLNVGYTYNPSDGSYIQTTRHLVQASVGYNFKDAGLVLYADAAFGLNNETYVGKTYTDPATGEKNIPVPEKYQNDFYELDDGIPFYFAARAAFAATENLTLNAWARINHVLGVEDSLTSTTVYPYFDYKTSVGTFRSGAKFYFNDDDGFKGFDIPLSWKFTISK